MNHTKSFPVLLFVSCLFTVNNPLQACAVNKKSKNNTEWARMEIYNLLKTERKLADVPSQSLPHRYIRSLTNQLKVKALQRVLIKINSWPYGRLCQKNNVKYLYTFMVNNKLSDDDIVFFWSLLEKLRTSKPFYFYENPYTALTYAYLFDMYRINQDLPQQYGSLIQEIRIFTNGEQWYISYPSVPYHEVQKNRIKLNLDSASDIPYFKIIEKTNPDGNTIITFIESPLNKQSSS